MEVSYLKLFSLLVRHEYFGGGPGPDLVVEPDADTARLMQGHRMRLRQQTGGAALFVGIRNRVPGDGKTGEQVVRQALAKQPLRFLLTVREPLFYQYTALDPSASPDASVAVFNNLKIFKDQIQDDGMRLDRPGDLEIMPVRGTEPGTYVSLDRPAAEVFGIVTVHLGETAMPPVQTGMKAVTIGERQEPAYIIDLPARKARWRYLVAGADEGAEIKATDIASGNSIYFNAPAPAEIAGRQAQIHESREQFPVLHDPRGVFSATLASPDGHERVLPLPSVSALKASADGKGMVAEMVVLAERVA